VLVAQLGSEVAALLSAALDRVAALEASGRIDRAGLRALRLEIERARRAGIIAQQVVRLGSGGLQLAPERIDLTALLREALLQRGREIEARGIEVQQVFAPAEVMSDATLMFALLQVVLDWSFEHAVSRIDLDLAVMNWPADARLLVAFYHQPPDEVDTASAPLEAFEEASLSTMSWRLLQQTAAVLGLCLARRDAPARTELRIDFPCTVAPSLSALEGAQTASVIAGAPPLAGRQVLLLASQREIRNLVRQALRPLGLKLEIATSIEEVRPICRSLVPHAVVYESALAGDAFEHLRSEMLAELPQLAFIRIADQGRAFEVLNLGGRQVASVGRDAIIESLPSALLFELARCG
jgi:hypothetical protein